MTPGYGSSSHESSSYKRSRSPAKNSYSAYDENNHYDQNSKYSKRSSDDYRRGNNYGNHDYRSSSSSYSRRQDGEDGFSSHKPKGFGGLTFAGSDKYGNSSQISSTFDANNAIPIHKELYKEHQDVAKMTDSEVEAFRREAAMTLNGHGIPRPISKFEHACLPREIMEEIKKSGFDKPTPIQAQGWPMALSGKNMVGIAQTGSGKTLSFVIPALVHIAAQPPTQRGDGPVVLVLAPTRELAVQIQAVAEQYGRSMRLKSICLYGGAPKSQQIRGLRSLNPEIVVATPGRLIDIIKMGALSLKRCSFVVLDEADRMLDMGFEPQLREILPLIRPDRQVLMWSATWPKEVQNLAYTYLGTFIQVNIGSMELTTNKKIKQVFEFCENEQKETLLAGILEKLWNDSHEDASKRFMPRCLVFTNTKRMADELVYKMKQDQWPAEAIHGDKSQMDRDRILDNFKNGRKPILVATDVAARGLDVKDVVAVINYDFPSNIEDYVHRIGRTARGKNTEGTSFAFFTYDNRGNARDLIELLKSADQEVPSQLISMVPSRSNNSNFSRYGRGNRFGGNNSRNNRRW